MKTAISIPEELNESIEAFRKATKLSRSEFFQRAARLYLRSVSAKAITASLDRVYGSEDLSADAPFRRAALARLWAVMERKEG